MKHVITPKRILAVTVFSLALLFTITTASNASAQTALSMSLDVGSRGADVTSLQTFLARDTSIYPSGQITGYYGPLTAAAVTRFQTRYGISAVGRVGPQTRAKINELIASGGFGTGAGTDMSATKAPYIFAATSTLNNQTNGNPNNLASSSVAISWQTDEPARGKVFYGTSPFSLTESSNPTVAPTIIGASTIMADDTYTTSKTITLSNLWQNNTNPNNYYYMIQAIDANGNISVTWPQMFNSSGISQ